MFERGYRQQLEADLVKWVAGGVISGDAAQSIRKARFGEEAASRLPAIFAMLGALMLAASVSAFVAANWQEIPRLVRLVGILALIAGCFFPAWLLERRGMPNGCRCGDYVRYALLWRGRSPCRSDVSPAGGLAGRRDADRDRWIGSRGIDGQERPPRHCIRGDDVMVMGKVRRLAMARNPLVVSAAVRAGFSAGPGP